MGATAARAVSATASTSPARIVRTRPQRTARAAAGSTQSASAPVLAETARAARVGLTPNSSLICGSTGCAAYRIPNAPSPASIIARLNRR